MKKRLLDFREKLSRKKKIQMAVITFIVGIILELVIAGIHMEVFAMSKVFLLAILTCVIAICTSVFTALWIGDIIINDQRERFEKEENEAHERLKLILTNEFKTFSLKTDGDYDYFTKILVKEVPYVFKAKMENDIIYYQFETKDGEIFHSGEFTGYSFFEKHTKS